MKKLTFQNLQVLPYQVEESLNRIRVNFGFIGPEYKKIIVTSSTENEGKSFVAFNIWRMLAEAGKTAVFVDADIRKSVLRSRYQITGEKEGYLGLAFYLSGRATIQDIVYETTVPNGFYVPVSYTVSNPALLLQDKRFPNLLDTLADNFDYVIVDTPPLTAVADGDLIASHCDGAILVIRGGVTPRKLIANAMKQLENANCKLLGTVLNRVELSNSSYYYRKYYGKRKYYNSYYSSYGSDSKPTPEEAKLSENKDAAE